MLGLDTITLEAVSHWKMKTKVISIDPCFNVIVPRQGQVAGELTFGQLYTCWILCIKYLDSMLNLCGEDYMGRRVDFLSIVYMLDLMY